MYYYQVYDLIFASSFIIREFSNVAVDPVEYPDVTIRQGEVPQNLPRAQKTGVCYQLGHDTLQLNVEGIARYWANSGREIVIDSNPSAPIGDVNALLLDAPITGILHQRGMLPLYGSAVEVANNCILFCGISGVGKSSAAREFIKRGYKLVTDDLAVITERNREIVVVPGYPSQRLPIDVITRNGWDAGGYQTIRSNNHQRCVPVSSDDWSGNTLALRKTYIITTENITEVELNELEAGELKFNLLHDAMHRQYLSGMGGGFKLLKPIAELVKTIPAVHVIRPMTGGQIPQMIMAIESDMDRCIM